MKQLTSDVQVGGSFKKKKDFTGKEQALISLLLNFITTGLFTHEQYNT